MLLLFLTSSITFSQTLGLNEKGDTTITFGINKGRYLLKEHYKLQECNKLDSICEQQRAYSDSVATYQTKNATDYKKVIENDKEIVFVKDNQIEGLKTDLATANKRLKLQKVYKWVAIVGGGAVSGFLGFKYLTK